MIAVTFELPNTQPDIVEQTATSILESSLSQISGIKKIYSISNFGSGKIEVEFYPDVNLAFKKFEISSLIRRIHTKLPLEATLPMVSERGIKSENDKPLLIYQINSNLESSKIEKTVKNLLVNAISQKAGVKDVMINGASKLQITIAFDSDKIKQLNIPTSEISSQLEKRFRTLYPGAILTPGNQKFTIKAGTSPTSLDDLKSTTILVIEKQQIALKEFAEVFIQDSAPTEFFRVNGLNAITLSIYADEKVNRIELAEAIESLIETRSEILPNGYTIVQDFNDTSRLQEEINKNIFRSITSFAILFIFLLIFYRSKKHLITLFSGIFVSLGLTALAAYFIGLQINLYTIAGLTISLGIIIDNSIVVIDHIRTKKNRKISIAITGAALTTITALLLVFLLPEEDRQTLSDFCICVALAIAMSVITAIFFTPAIFQIQSRTNSVSRLPIAKLRRQVWMYKMYYLAITSLGHYRKTFVTVLVLIFGLPVFMLPTKWDGQDWYNKTFGSEIYQESIRPVSDKILGGALRLFIFDMSEKHSYREEDPIELEVNAELGFGNTIEDMNRIMKTIEIYLSQVKGIDKFITEVYSGQRAKIRITFGTNAEKSVLPFALRRNLISLSNNWNGVRFTIYGIGDTFENTSYSGISTFRVELKGYNYNQLDKYATSLTNLLSKHKRITNINTNEVLRWDENEIEQYKLAFHSNARLDNKDEVLSKILVNGEPNSPSMFLTMNDEQFPVMIRSQEELPSLYNVMESYIPTSDNETVKISSLATLKKEIVPNAIHKEDRQYLRILSFDYTGSSHFGSEFLDESLHALTDEMMPGYSAKSDKSVWDWDKTKRQYEILLILIIAVYVICAIIFESYKQPMAIICTIPLSFIGPFLAFTLFGFYFDQGGYASFILLGGLVANASIYIINDLNNEKRYHYNKRVIRAVAGKMKPIALTIFSSCLGLLPFMILSQNEVFWFALALGTTSGLLVSLVMIYVALPVMLLRNT